MSVRRGLIEASASSKARPRREPLSAPHTPTPAEIVAGRERVQAARNIGITAAQSWCAEQVCTTLRRWQEWEQGKHRMHPGLWKLFRLS